MQFIGNGFVVTYLVNFFVFAYYPVLVERAEIKTVSRSALILAGDILAKIILFSLLKFLLMYFWLVFKGHSPEIK